MWRNEIIFLLILINLTCSTLVADKFNDDISRDFDDCDYNFSCVRKCCENGYVFYKKKCNKNNSTAPFVVPVYNNKSLIGTISRSAKFNVKPMNCTVYKLKTTSTYFLQENGSLWVQNYATLYTNDLYCLDEANGVTVYLCFLKKITPLSKIISKVTKATGKVVRITCILLLFLLNYF